MNRHLCGTVIRGEPELLRIQGYIPKRRNYPLHVMEGWISAPLPKWMGDQLK